MSASSGRWISCTRKIIWRYRSKLDQAESLSTGLLVTLMMGKVRTSETSVSSNETTWRYIPQSCHHTRRADLKFYHEGFQQVFCMNFSVFCVLYVLPFIRSSFVAESTNYQFSHYLGLISSNFVIFSVLCIQILFYIPCSKEEPGRPG
jgi:hypothetical protein